MAYYLEEGYDAPSAYDSRRFRAGLDKVQNGENNSRDYDIATYVGAKLIFQSLIEGYPAMLAEVEGLDPITANKTIAARLSAEERKQLLPMLKKAIASSADRGVFGTILEQTKQ